MTMSDHARAQFARYQELQHAMQSGVAMEMNIRSGPTEPKHLRVGVNTAMVEHAAVAQLLIAHGIVTEDEYADALVAAMERELADYQRTLSQQLGTEVFLA